MDDKFSVGDVVRSGHSETKGTVVSVDATTCTMSVVWEDGDGGAIVYPLDAVFLHKVVRFPWES